MSVLRRDDGKLNNLAVGPCSPGSDQDCIFVGDIGDNLAKESAKRRYTQPGVGQLHGGQ